MAFTVKNWQDLPSTTTPLSAAALEDLEARVTAYADSVAVPGSDPNALPKTVLDAKGDLIAASANDTAVRVGIPTLGGDRASLVTDSSQTAGVRYSVKAAPYNPYEVSSGVGQGTAATDRAALQTCANAAAAARAPMVIPPSATPLLIDSTAWAIPANSHIYGYGRGKSMIKIANGVTQPENITNSNIATGDRNITLDGLDIDGNATNRTGAGGVMVFRNQLTNGVNPEGFTMRNCYIHDSPGIAFLILSYDQVELSHNICDGGNRDGLDLISCHGAHITNNLVTDMVDDAIVLGGQTGDQATLGTYSSDAVIADNVVSNARWPDPDGLGSGQGIRVSGTRRLAIADNTIYRANTSGIALHPQNGMPTTDVAITGNIIRDVGAPKFEGGLAGTPSDVAWGIMLANTNWFSDNTPVSGHSAVSNVLIANNIIDAPMAHGLRMNGSAQADSTMHDISVMNNQFIGNYTAAHVADAQHAIFFLNQYVRHVMISGNLFQNWNGRAIAASSGNQFINIENNKIISCCRANNTYAAMDLTNASDVVWRGNKVFDGSSPKTQAYAVAWGGVAGARMFGNDFSEGGRLGTVAGTPSSQIQSNNIDKDGVLKAGTAPTAGNLT